MNINQMSMKVKQKKQGGFTLVELLIVVVILGVLAAMTFGTFSSSATSTATAQQYYNLANRGTQAWSQMVAVSGAPRTINGNPVFGGNNGLLDMLVAGELVVANEYKNAYRRAGLAPSEDMVQIETFPTATERGAYKVGTVDVSVSDRSGDAGALNWLFEGVTQETVAALVEQHEPSETGYTLGVAVSGRRIQATTASGGLMDLTIVTRVQ